MSTLPFPNRISSSSTDDYSQTVIIADYGDNYEQRAAVGIESFKRQFNVAWNGLNKTDRDVLIAFWYSHGLVLSFDWTPPFESTPLKWVFSESIQETNDGCIYNIAATLRQVRA